MPALPTITVTQENMDRLIATFGTAQNYKQELRIWIRERVTEFETRKTMDQHQQELIAKRQQIKTDLSDTALQ